MFLRGMTMMMVGHSTLSIEDFLHALRENGCRLLVDVRRYPGSRRYPQFGQTALFASLAAHGIEGVWREGLGGRRKALSDSVNDGWREESFRGYADYMQTPEFEREMEWLAGRDDLRTVAVMCAEAVPSRCHRSLIADAMLVRGMEVENLFIEAGGRSYFKRHAMTSFAKVEGGRRLWYPGEGGLFG